MAWSHKRTAHRRKGIPEHRSLKHPHKGVKGHHHKHVTKK